jgi:hypothetical protein
MPGDVTYLDNTTFLPRTIMTKTFKLSATHERIVAEYPEKNLKLEFPNIIGYQTDTHELLSVGESREAVECRLQAIKDGAKLSALLSTGKSFMWDDEIGGKWDFFVIDYYFSGLLQNSVMLYVYMYLLGLFHFDLSIEEYDKWSEERKARLENGLQIGPRARSLSINGVIKSMPLLKRYAEIILYDVSKLLILICLSTYISSPPLSLSPTWRLPLLLLVGIPVAAVIWVGGVYIWLLVLKNKFPIAYRRFRIERLHNRLIKRLAQKLGVY